MELSGRAYHGPWKNPLHFLDTQYLSLYSKFRDRALGLGGSLLSSSALLLFIGFYFKLMD